MEKNKFLPYCKSWFKVDEFKDGFLYSLFYKTINLDGIPYMLNVWKNKIEFHPVTVCQYALYYYNEKRFNDFLRLTRFLVYKQNNGWLYHDFKPKLWGYKFEIPWVSGMVQGMFLSVLVRAVKLTNNKKYSVLAKKVYETLRSPKIRKKNWIYEFGTNNPRVLNGHLYALIGIKEYTNKKPRKTCVINYMYDFTYNTGWTNYDDGDLVADSHYHERHKNLFKEVYGYEVEDWKNATRPELTYWSCIIEQKIRGLLS